MPYNYPRPLLLCEEEDVKELWDQRAAYLESAGVRFLELFRRACPGIAERSFYLHAMIAHVPDNVRQVGSVAAYSTEALESGHHWMNETLVHGTNSRKHERMKQVLDAKLRDEYLCDQDEDIREAVEREDVKREHMKIVRVQAAKQRAVDCLNDVKKALSDGSELKGQDLGQHLVKVKRERQALKRKRM
jgi:hypothetical protein